MRVQQVDVQAKELKRVKVKKAKAPKKPKERRDVRTVFRKHLTALEIEKLKKPWMSTKAFRTIDTKDALWDWARGVVADQSRYHLNPIAKKSEPVVAVDTENTGLDTRIIPIFTEHGDRTLSVRYEVNVEIAGVCLSADGIEGIYVPIHHQMGYWVRPTYDDATPPNLLDAGHWTEAINITREDVAEVLQWLFDQCHLVFYNAKYDREIIRICLGITLRGYPYFEDVQVMHYINDPKHDFGDRQRGQYTGDSGGLKALSLNQLGIEQIQGEELMKVKADFCPLADSAFRCKCTPDNNKKHTSRVVYVPFTWVPTEYSLWYAAGDAICTWLLWHKFKDQARERGLIHRIDHELVESLTFLERQRFLVDSTRLHRTISWHARKLMNMRGGLRRLAIEAGLKEEQQEDGTILEDNRFNVDSPPQLAKFLFGVKKLKVIRMGKVLPSCDAEVIDELKKLYPDDEFLKLFSDYKAYVALHPENLRYDERDHTARVYLKQNVVAGGRLSGAGGDFEVDGGFGLNPQGIVRVEGNWWVRGNVLHPDAVAAEDIEEHAPEDLHPSCYKENKKGGKDQAPGIVKNHIANFQGYAICLVPSCKTCAEKFGILIPNTRMDANEVINIRSLMVVEPGWTFFTIDYSNIEMRAAANCSGEPEFIKEFLEGKGDFHSLTASKVFPDFNNPNIDKAVKKALRSLAKIINFALLYGGTEYTIFENMKKEKPDITWEECKKMVADYWAGVPVFAEFCSRKQNIAREKMLVTTSTGRVIYFQSAMDALGIHVPNEEEKDNYWQYRNLVKKEEAAKKAGNDEVAAKCKAAYDRLWKDQTTGVRNYIDHSKFMGKIQRVAVNVPLQGLAGDFMRIALNRIRAWVMSDPFIQSVFRLHCSVHDEIDFAVKNEYVPFIIPRITRLMKLRKYHEKMQWRVGIETDCEYGHSWDVEHHLTGDDGHAPAGWSKIEGMENYLPADWEGTTVKGLLDALCSNQPERIDKAGDFLKKNLHERVQDAVKGIFALTAQQAPRAKVKTALLVAIQLHEFWRIDHIPDGQDETMEKLEEFEQRNGLTAANRGNMPEFGYLGAVPLKADVKRPTLEILGEDVPVEDVSITVSGTEITVEAASMCEDCDPAHECPGPDKQGELLRSPEITEKISLQPPTAKVSDTVPELREMTHAELKKFRTAMGVGRKKITVRYQGKMFDLGDVGASVVPAEFLKEMAVV